MIALSCIHFCAKEDKGMGLTNSRRWWLAEEMSVVHPSSCKPIVNDKKKNLKDTTNEKKEEEEEDNGKKSNEVCF